MTTVFVLPGAFGVAASMPPMLRGDICRGNKVEGITYPNNLIAYWPGTGIGTPQMLQGATTLNEALNDTPGQKIVMGHSLGSAVCDYWHGHFGPTSKLDPGEVTFYLLGDSMRRYGGFVFFNSGGDSNSANTGFACPKNTRYTTFNIVRQYDGWGDWPTSKTDTNFFGMLDAWGNANDGMSTVHDYYQDVDINNPAIWRYQEGNVIYMVVPTYPLPMVVGTWWEPIAQADAQYRKTVEEGYARPAYTIPSYMGQTQYIPPTKGAMAPSGLWTPVPMVDVPAYTPGSSGSSGQTGGNSGSSTGSTGQTSGSAVATLPGITAQAMPVSGTLAQPGDDLNVATADRRIPTNA